ncbi:hypothetical protein CYMTET_33161, partial [Cymbomonas tetramitiformis]
MQAHVAALGSRAIAFPSAQIMKQADKFQALAGLHLKTHVDSNPAVQQALAVLEAHSCLADHRSAVLEKPLNMVWQYLSVQAHFNPQWDRDEVMESLREYCRFQDKTWPGRRYILSANHRLGHPAVVLFADVLHTPEGERAVEIMRQQDEFTEVVRASREAYQSACTHTALQIAREARVILCTVDHLHVALRELQQARARPLPLQNRPEGPRRATLITARLHRIAARALEPGQ